jgi:hypothetical protein
MGALLDLTLPLAPSIRPLTDLTDSTGATAKSYSYDAYGNIIDQTGTLEQCPVHLSGAGFSDGLLNDFPSNLSLPPHRVLISFPA